MLRPSAIALGITAVVAPILAVTIPVYACNPEGSTNRPVCPGTATLDTASFLDPTVHISHHTHVKLGKKTYIGPFAHLNEHDSTHTATEHITIGDESNVQDHVFIDAHWDRHRNATENSKVTAPPGVHIGNRVILAHRAAVKGNAEIGVQQSSTLPSGCSATTPAPLAFVSFGAEVDGAIIEKNAQVGALARVGPGVRIKSGTTVAAGKNITNQTEATVGATGSKVTCFTQANAEFANTVIEANREFAKGYSELARADSNHTKVKGISVDPNTLISPNEQKPRFNSTGPGTGTEVTDHHFRNRIIGQIFIENTKESLDSNTHMGHKISLRADEGKDIKVGLINHMADNVIFHALEKNKNFPNEDNLTIGDNVTYGHGAIVHGGLAVVPNTNDEELPATKIENNVTLGRNSVVFRATIGDGASIGEKSLIFNSDIPAGTVIASKTIVANGIKTTNGVEW